MRKEKIVDFGILDCVMSYAMKFYSILGKLRTYFKQCRSREMVQKRVV